MDTNKASLASGAGKNLKKRVNNSTTLEKKWIIMALALLWLASGIFNVHSGEVAVVSRFDKYNRTLSNGTHYHLPFPIESVKFMQITKALKTITK